MVFFVLLWFSSRSFEYVHLPGLIGEVLLGSIFGPLLINLVPESHALIMLGEIGLVLLVVEAGLEIDLVYYMLLHPATHNMYITSFLPLLIERSP